MLILERYILRNFVGPFFFSTFIITFVFVMDFILRYIDPFLKRGIKPMVILEAFVLSLGHMFALIIPMAVLPATLMTYGNLAAENEITAMKATGVSLYRMVSPAIVISTVLTVLMIVFNNHVLPESNHRLRNLLINIYKKKPSVRIKENVFIDAFKGYTIYVRHKDDKTGQIKDVQIFKNIEGKALPTTIVAARGRVRYLEKEHLLRFELEDGEIHEMGKDAATYRRTTFRTYTMNIEDIDRSLKRTERKYRGDREMSVKQMREKIEGLKVKLALVDEKIREIAHHPMGAALELLDRRSRERILSTRPADSRHRPKMMIKPGRGARKTPPREAEEYVARKAIESQIAVRESYLRQIDRYLVEIHKKFSIPFACLIFVVVGAPLAIRTGRSGMNTAIGVSILFFLVYYVCLIGGEKLADRRLISPFVAMWAPNIVFGLGGTYLLWKADREESIFHWMGASFSRLRRKQ